MHLITIKTAAGKVYIRNHLKGCSDHFVISIYHAPNRPLKPLNGKLGRHTQQRGKVRDIAMRENRSCRTTLPAPLGPFGQKHGITNRRAHQAVCRVGLWTSIQFRKQYSAQTVRVHRYMPANSNFARNNRLTRCNFWDDAEQVLPRGLECTKDPPRACLPGVRVQAGRTMLCSCFTGGPLPVKNQYFANYEVKCIA